ncbi:MAG: META domain-containing protein [Rhodovulum sp.]
MKRITALVLCALPLAAAAQDTRQISGSLAYRERIALPPDARMLVELRDDTGALVARRAAPTEGAQVPLPFAVAAPSGPALSLRAGLRLGGAVRWLSQPVAIETGTDPVPLGMVPLRGVQPMGFAATFSCGELTADLGVVEGGARLRVGGRYLDLVPEPTASGAKYVAPDDPETWIWTKGDAATLRLSGTSFPECTETLPGDRYTARGNEPGWTLRIADGQMRYLGDYGETDITVPQPAPETVDGARRYAAEGADLVLSLRLELCHDDMTGMPHPARATVETGGRHLSGCGGDPMDLLTAHPWQVEEIAGGGIVEESTVTLAFLPGGRVAGSTGCNRFNGGVEMTGEGLRFAPLAVTMMACPEALMAQERRLLDALARVDRFDILPGGALHLIAGGDTVVTARR